MERFYKMGCCTPRCVSRAFCYALSSFSSRSPPLCCPVPPMSPWPSPPCLLLILVEEPLLGSFVIYASNSYTYLFPPHTLLLSYRIQIGPEEPEDNLPKFLGKDNLPHRIRFPLKPQPHAWILQLWISRMGLRVVAFTQVVLLHCVSLFLLHHPWLHILHHPITTPLH